MHHRHLRVAVGTVLLPVLQVAVVVVTEDHQEIKSTLMEDHPSHMVEEMEVTMREKEGGIRRL